MRKYKTAVRQRNIQVEGHRGFTTTLPKALTADWEKMCEEWDDATYPKKVENPFVTRGLCTSPFLYLSWPLSPNVVWLRRPNGGTEEEGARRGGNCATE